MTIKDLVGQRMKKKVKFMNADVTIQKLTIAEVMEIQEKAKGADEDEKRSFEVLRKVVRSAVEGAEDLSDEDFDTFPMDELSKLSNEIMRFSGLGEAGK